jgi:hypothetical protein
MVVLNAIDDYYLAITFLITGTSLSLMEEKLIDSWISTRILRICMDLPIR